MNKQRTTWGPFDRSVWTDWVWYLFVIAVIVALAGLRDYYSLIDPVTGERKFSIEGQELAFLTDIVVRVAIQFVLFACIPSWIRSALRRRRGAVA